MITSPIQKYIWGKFSKKLFPRKESSHVKRNRERSQGVEFFVLVVGLLIDGSGFVIEGSSLGVIEVGSG